MVASDVFHGTYSGNSSDNHREETTFYNNTFTQKVHANSNQEYNRFGFYSSSEYEGEKYIGLTFPNSSYSESYKRKNIFVLERNGSNFYCSTAIFLQVLYAFDYLMSVLILTLYNIKFWKGFLSSY